MHFNFLKNTFSLFIIYKPFELWDTENVLINNLLLVIPYPCHYTNLCPHKPHKHAHIHTHTTICIEIMNNIIIGLSANDTLNEAHNLYKSDVYQSFCYYFLFIPVHLAIIRASVCVCRNKTSSCLIVINLTSAHLSSK